MRRARVPVACALLVAWPAFAQAAEPQHLKVALHIHSTVSTGALEPQAIALLAQQAGLDGLIFTDSALRHWEYGLWPMRAVVKRVIEQPSVWTFGIERYLTAIRHLNDDPARPRAMAGLEAAPFYYWQRSPFDRRGGQIRGANQHLLIFGVSDPQFIRRLPLREYDPYHGNQEAKPYQRLIDVVGDHHGLVFWAHPAAGARVERLGSAEALVEPYPHLLELTERYHGLAIADLSSLGLVEPGGIWDRLLRAYCRGQRTRPAWVIGELDWHQPGLRPIDQVVTVVMAAERSSEAILQALRTGRMWVVFRTGEQAPILHRFEARALTGHATVGIDQSIAPLGPIRIQVSGRRGSPEPGPARVFLIKDGAIVHMEEVTADEFDLVWTDDAPPTRGFYRAVFQGPAGLIYTNPIFVRQTAPSNTPFG